MELILNSPSIKNSIEMKAQLINFQDEHGETALHIGARMGHKKVVECFLFAGADVNLK